MTCKQIPLAPCTHDVCRHLEERLQNIQDQAEESQHGISIAPAEQAIGNSNVNGNANSKE